MDVVQVRGADGSERELALVRIEGDRAHVCPLFKVGEVEAGDESSVVVFPAADIREPQNA